MALRFVEDSFWPDDAEIIDADRYELEVEEGAPDGIMTFFKSNVPVCERVSNPRTVVTEVP